jgi:hypothetical protein
LCSHSVVSHHHTELEYSQDIADKGAMSSEFLHPCSLCVDGCCLLIFDFKYRKFPNAVPSSVSGNLFRRDKILNHKLGIKLHVEPRLGKQGALLYTVTTIQIILNHIHYTLFCIKNGISTKQDWSSSLTWGSIKSSYKTDVMDYWIDTEKTLFHRQHLE